MISFHMTLCKIFFFMGIKTVKKNFILSQQNKDFPPLFENVIRFMPYECENRTYQESLLIRKIFCEKINFRELSQQQIDENMSDIVMDQSKRSSVDKLHLSKSYIA